MIRNIITKEKRNDMISVLLNWCYITIICFIFGYGFATFIEKKQNYQIKSPVAVIAIGLVMMTVYSQIFSIFYKVGMIANLLLLVMAIFICMATRVRMIQFIQEIKKMSRIRKLVECFLILLFAYFTSKGTMHYDSDLYHAQSIRWIEEYGVVPGLANLHNRFGYNSASFALSALFSMKWLLGTSVHAISGYFALLLGITTLDIAKSFPKKKFAISDYARIAAIFYLTLICDEIVSPASDYPIMCSIFYIVIQWLTLLEKDHENENTSCSAVPYALLCMGGAFAITLKVTAGFILVLAIKPIIQFAKEKKGKDILFYVVTALVIVSPWLVRNVIITGYLLYPFPAIDLFSFDYKLDAGASQYDANEIKVYGRGIYDVSRAGESLFIWVPYWFRETLNMLQKLFVLTDFACVIGTLAYGIVTIIKKKWDRLDLLLVMFMMTGSFFFWFFGAPMLRYGYAYVLLMAAVPIGVLIYRIGLKKLIYYPMLAFGILKLGFLMKYAVQILPQNQYIWQQEYGIYEMTSFQIGEVEVYYPVEGDRNGYDYFPATNRYVELELRGESIKDGFRMKQ